MQRAKSILSNPKYQLSAVQKVREIQASNRIRGVVPPYPTSGSTSSSAQAAQGIYFIFVFIKKCQKYFSNNFLIFYFLADLAMRRQQFLQNQNTLNRTPLLQQAAVCFGSSFNNAAQSGGSNSYGSYSGHFAQQQNNIGSTSTFSNFSYSSLANTGALNGQTRSLKFINLPFYDVKLVSYFLLFILSKVLVYRFGKIHLYLI